MNGYDSPTFLSLDILYVMKSLLFRYDNSPRNELQRSPPGV